MNSSWQAVLGWLTLAVSSAGLLAFIIYTLRHSEDPTRVLFKWVVTFVVGGFYVVFILRNRSLASTTAGAFVGPFVTAAVCIVIGLIWAPQLATAFVRPLTSALDGGDEPPEQKPFYSVAIAKRKRGLYEEAIAEIQRQLERFPEDCDGYMLLAEIQAEDLKDLAQAAETIQTLCDLPSTPPYRVADALTRLAEWHLRQTRDVEAARQILQSIQARFPNTDHAYRAAQKLAHLARQEDLEASRERKPIPVPKGVDDLGLRESTAELAPQVDPIALAAEYQAHLQEHPDDADTRENLARVYAEHFRRLDLAIEQLEQLVQNPHASPAEVARWLHRMADWHIKLGRDEAAARRCLERIIELYPGRALAERARQRLQTLRLELQGQASEHKLRLHRSEDERDAGSA